MGDGAVGKTSLRRKFMGENMDDNYVMTIGADFAIRRGVINDDLHVTYQIWDLAGQPRFDQVRGGFYKGGHGALIVCDLTRQETLESIEKWIDEMKSSLGKLVPFLLIGNKSDLRDQIPNGVAREMGQQYAEKISQLTKDLGFSVEFLETSALNGINVDEAFSSLSRKILQQGNGQ